MDRRGGAARTARQSRRLDPRPGDHARDHAPLTGRSGSGAQPSGHYWRAGISRQSARPTAQPAICQSAFERSGGVHQAVEQRDRELAEP